MESTPFWCMACGLSPMPTSGHCNARRTRVPRAGPRPWVMGYAFSVFVAAGHSSLAFSQTQPTIMRHPWRQLCPPRTPEHVPGRSPVISTCPRHGQPSLRRPGPRTPSCTPVLWLRARSAHSSTLCARTRLRTPVPGLPPAPPAVSSPQWPGRMMSPPCAGPPRPSLSP